MTNPRRRFRELLARPGVLSQPVVFDALGARLAEDLGFEAVGIGGYSLGAHLMTPEPLLSLSDVADATRRLVTATSLPVMVDAGAGWGEPVHVAHTVRVLERAGAASVHIEDQIFPKRVHYHKGVEHVISQSEMVDKVRSAVAARTDPDFVIIARTDAMRTDGYDEGIRRARAYMAAGADMIMLFPNDDAETRQTPKDLPGVPLEYVNSSGNRLGRGIYPVDELGSWGWKVVGDAITAVNVYAMALQEAFSRLRDTGSTGRCEDQMREVRKGIEAAMRMEDYYKIEEETVEDGFRE